MAVRTPTIDSQVHAFPVGKSSAGLPVTMQFVGRFFRDPLVMMEAYAYQQSHGLDKIIGVNSWSQMPTF